MTRAGWVVLRVGMVCGLLAFGGWGCGGAPAGASSGEPGLIAPARPKVDEKIREIPASLVSRDYGTLVISASDIARAGRGELNAWTEHKPWSSWWYPMSDDYLYAKPASPLAKYDAYARKKGKNTQAAKKEENLPLRRTAGVDWAGYCHAWSMASLLSKEPFARDLEGIHFSVGDLKALLIKSFDGYSGAIRYGEPTADDLTPRDLHQLVQAEVIGARRGFILDYNPHEPIWNVPVYGADVTQLAKDAQDPERLHVTVSLLAASPQVFVRNGSRMDPNYEYIGTEPLNLIYTYDLQGRWTPEGSFEVYSSQWTGSSVQEHPGFMLVLKLRGTRSSDNDQILPELVDEIVGRAPMIRAP